MSSWLQVLTAFCAVGAGATSGVFLTFSTFTMKGLERLPPAQGAAAMQSINAEAPRAPLLLLMFGTGAASLLLSLHAALNLADPGSTYRLVAGALYVAGVVVLTGTYHVPRNDRLAALDANSAEGLSCWAVYRREWVRMNHVRTLAALGAAVLFTLSLPGEC